jgi:adenylate cyclase
VSITSTITKSRVHIASGLVLAFFIAGHFINHALGISSIELMEAGRAGFNILWRSIPGTALLYGALLTHFALALDALWRRGSFRMPVGEALKILFGLALPFLLAEHVVATRLEFSLTGHVRGYTEVLRSMWISNGTAAFYTAALVIAWAHGCLGIWFWLRGKLWFQRVAPIFHMIAVIVPVLAILGFYSGMHASATAAPTQNTEAPLPLATLYRIIYSFYAAFLLVISGVILVKFIPQRHKIRIRYAGGRTVSVNPGLSILEASRSAGIPHVSICGGRGRCSTCRVQILEGLEGQPAAETRELATLKSIGAGVDVRLACQLRPIHDLTVLPLVDVGSTLLAARQAPNAIAGQERMVAALFCDLRSFTQLSEKKLPYDVVFLLNRYFTVVDQAVEASGGMVDKFIGDGAIALFGIETSYSQACRQALQAAVRLAEGIEKLNASFTAELDAPLRIAMGLHAGPAIVGRMGHGKATSLTAIGDTINTASRLEGLAKQKNVELVVSADLVRLAGVTFPGHEVEELEIRGRAATLETWTVLKATDISAALTNPAVAAVA